IRVRPPAVDAAVGGVVRDDVDRQRRTRLDNVAERVVVVGRVSCRCSFEVAVAEDDHVECTVPSEFIQYSLPHRRTYLPSFFHAFISPIIRSRTAMSGSVFLGSPMNDRKYSGISSTPTPLTLKARTSIGPIAKPTLSIYPSCAFSALFAA